MRKIVTIPLLLLGFNLVAQQHPVAFSTRTELIEVKSSLLKNSLLKQSYAEMKKVVDPWIGKEIDTPIPKDPAGGYTHEKHKENYMLLFNSASLYQLTGDVKYALLVKNLFFKYASLNPNLANHPESAGAYPGKLFWQALNDANWLVYAGLAFDGIHDYLTSGERKQIFEGAFKPELDYFTKDLKNWVNLIHNHAVWACAGVGIVGIATDHEEYVQMALYGTQKDGKAGFLAQLDGLFSPDGYYTEGPYYTRYALLPFYLFANALNNTKPQLKVFQYRNKILQKALDGALQQTNVNGGFFSYNDALKDKTFISNELVVAIDIAWQVYGANHAYLPVAREQNRVILHKGGVGISEALIKEKMIPAYFPYQSVEFTDGAKGNEGGVSVIRAGKDDNLTSLIYKYSAHGLSHGHFDKLSINLFDNGNEILQDYGAVRYIGIEQKWGGRYLPESKAYAQQTIAHNTLTVDETSHFNALEKESEKCHPVKLFGNIVNKKVKVVSVLDDKAYKDVSMQRSIYMIQLPGATKPFLIDIFRALASAQHQYDLPFNYMGTVISTNFKYKASNSNQVTLGSKNGYQYLWKTAEATTHIPFTQFTFLNNNTFYTISSFTGNETQIYFTRLGANDPDFNLRPETAYIIRTKGSNQTYINAIEIHGNYNSVSEVANATYSTVSGIQKLQDDDRLTAVEMKVNGKSLLVIQVNMGFETNAKHSFLHNNQQTDFIGPYAVYYDGEKLQ